MPRKETALAVLLGICAFGIVASKSLFVEGEAAGGSVPALHATTEMSLEEILTEDAVGDFQAEAPPKHPEQRARAADKPTRPAPGRSSVPAGYVYWKTVRAKVTAYDPSRRSCGRFADGRTSIGQSAWVMDGVAADPTAIPYGTYVVIPGVGAKQVDDTGSAMRKSWRRYGRYHVDLRMHYPYQANRWGVKYLDVKLYRKAR